MSEEVLRSKLDRLQRRIDLLEGMIEDRSRDLWVTNQKLTAAAEFLCGIYKAMPGALIVFDRSGVIEAVNQAAFALLEYEESELIGQPVSLLFDAKDVPDFTQIEAALPLGGVLRVEKSCRTKNGKALPVLFSAKLIPGAPGSERASRGVVCIVLDLRDQKKLEIELRQAHKLESVGRLASGIAHEINTPIQFVSDSIHFLKDAFADITELIGKYQELHGSGLDERALAQAAMAEEEAELSYLIENVPKALERSLDGIGRVATIVRSMKDFAHPDQREMAPVNLNKGIQSTITIARNEYKYTADLETVLGDIPSVTCHAGDVNQVILNLLVNAAHAVGEVVKDSGCKGRITVRSWQEGDRAVVAISDTGGGIPEGIQDQIFDPFFTTKGVGKGTGQGLALARSVIVEKHGGDLTFETEPGKGTTFFVRLPINGKMSLTTEAA